MKNDLAEDFERRLSVMETEHSYIQKSLDKLEEKVDISNEVVMSVKERLDKQNGIMPRMAKQQDLFMDKFDNYVIRFNDHVIDDAAIEFKVKILWGAIAALSSGFIIAVIKLLLQ